MPSLPGADPAHLRGESWPGRRTCCGSTRFNFEAHAGRDPTSGQPRWACCSTRTALRSALSLGRRPGCGPARRASTPPAPRACLQRETVTGVTPTSLATPRTPLPSCNKLAPIIRRIPSASAPPFVLMAQIISTRRYCRSTSVNNRPNGWSQSCEAAGSSLPAAAEEIVRQGKSIRHEELWQALKWPSG
jgi:hypothetical protein